MKQGCRKQLLIYINIVLWIIFLSTLIRVSVANAEPVILYWEATTEVSLTKYRVYMSEQQRIVYIGKQWTAEIPAGTEEYTIDVPTDKPYYFVVTSVHIKNGIQVEIGPSNEVTSMLLPPTGLRMEW